MSAAETVSREEKKHASRYRVSHSRLRARSIRVDCMRRTAPTGQLVSACAPRSAFVRDDIMVGTAVGCDALESCRPYEHGQSRSFCHLRCRSAHRNSIQCTTICAPVFTESGFVVLRIHAGVDDPSGWSWRCPELECVQVHYRGRSSGRLWTSDNGSA